MQEYIKIPAIFQKIKTAEADYKPIYISGMSGFGKTASVKYYLRRKSYVSLSGLKGKLDDMPDPDDFRSSVVVIDDISWITDEKSQNYILKLLFRKDLWVIMIGRSQLPKWLRMADMQIEIVRASEADLVFNKKEIQELFVVHGINLSQDELQSIYEFSSGYPVILILIIKRLKAGEIYNNDIFINVRMDMFQYADYAFYDLWRDDLKEVLLSVCEFDSFTPEMIYFLTKKENIADIIEYANSVGSFLKRQADGSLSINGFLQRYLGWKKAFVYSAQDYIDNYTLVAEYYENEGEIVDAAFYYRKAKREDKVREILINNAKLHAGSGYYFELRDYYFEIPEEEVRKSPLLMAAISLLYSIMLMPDEAEEYYDMLVEFSNSDITKEEKKEAEIRIAYLNISLPHRGITNAIDFIHDTAALFFNKKYKMPELSITSNLPSLMNGGLDFCEWSKKDKELAVLLAKPLELLLGKQVKGLVNFALAESGYEKNTISEAELVSKLNQGMMQAGAGGRIEIEFAGLGIMERQLVFYGDIQLAQKRLDSFKTKAVNQKARQLFPNIEVMCIWLSLLQGNTAPAINWLKTSPDENEEFCILRRYQYIHKVRMLIALEKYPEAIALIERLDYYFSNYQRTMLWMENQLLKSIIYFRLNYPQWKEILVQTISKAQEYHFIKVVAMEGAAIKPLIDKLKTITGDTEFDRELINSVAQMAKFYPDYLKTNANETVPLTDKEKEILKLMVTGASSEEICRVCDITYNSLKFHNKNIYKKLGVNSRQEAERKALNLKLY